MPRISIIIPTYNRAPLLKNALDSVLAQTFQNFEVILIDDDSTDNTANVVSAYSQRVIYTRIEHSGLPAVVRNVGLQTAQGDYIAFLDSDDQWLPQKLERQTEILDKYPNVGLVCSNAYVLENGQDKLVQLYLRDEQGRSGWVLKDLLKDNFVICSTAFIRRSLLNRVGIFSEDPLLRAVEDYDLWLRISEVSEVHYIPEALAAYRSHAGSLRTQQSRVSYLKGTLRILERLKQRLKDREYRDALTEQLINNRAHTYCSQLLNAHLVPAQYLYAAKCALQLTQQRPIEGLELIYRIIRKGIMEILRERWS